MAANLGNAYVNIVPKAPGISNNIEGIFGGSEASAGIKKAGSGLGSKLVAGLKVTAVAGAAALGALIKQSLEAGGNLEQSFGGLDIIFGGAAAQAKIFAENAAQMGISANTYAEQAVGMGAALKQAFGGDSTKAMEAANLAITDMADNAAKMGTPIESLQNAYAGFSKQNYTMLDNLKLGYGGTKEEMERLIRDAEKLSDTFSVTHKKTKKGQDEIKYSYGDIVEAIHIVQDNLGIAGVAAAEASETLSGSAGAMKASWENLMAAMSTGEGLETAMANLGKSVSDFASNVLRMLGNLKKQMPALIKALGSKVIKKAPEFIHAGLELMVKLAVGVVQGIPKVVAKLPEIFAKVKASFAGYDWGALGTELVAGLVAGLKDMGKDVWNAIKSALSSLGSQIWAWIKQLIKDAVTGGGGDDGNEGGNGGARTNKAAANSIPRTAGAGAPNRFRTAQAKNGGTAEDIASLLRSGIKVQSVVVLEGDARQMLRVVNKANYSDTVRTGKNLLAAKG